MLLEIILQVVDLHTALIEVAPRKAGPAVEPVVGLAVDRVVVPVVGPVVAAALPRPQIKAPPESLAVPEKSS